MSCDVAALPFQAYANYGTWSIDFGNCHVIILNFGDTNNIFADYMFFVTIKSIQTYCG